MAFSITSVGSNNTIFPGQKAVIQVTGDILTTAGYVKLEDAAGNVIANQTVISWDNSAGTITILVQQRGLKYGTTDKVLRVTLADYTEETVSGVTLEPETGTKFRDLVDPITEEDTVNGILGVELLDESQVSWKDVNDLGITVQPDGTVGGVRGQFYLRAWDPATAEWSAYKLVDSGDRGFDLTMTGPIIGYPDLYPDTLNVEQLTKEISFESDFNGIETSSEMPGSRWKFSLQFGRRSGREARQLAALLLATKGRQGRFNITVANFAPLNGTALGSPRVNGAGQSGDTLITDGWLANQPEALAVGDYFSVNGELKMAVEPVAVTGTGAAIIRFEPQLHQAPPDNAQIITRQPTCRVKRISNFKFSLTSPVLYGIDLVAVEAIDG